MIVSIYLGGQWDSGIHEIIDSVIASNVRTVGLPQVSHEIIDSMIASNDLGGQWGFLM